MSEPSWPGHARIYGYISTASLIAVEVYHIVDREWAAYQSIQLFLVTELASAVAMLATANVAKSNQGAALLAFYVEALGLVFGVAASFATGNALTVCTYLDQSTKEKASMCIETYSSYAAIDGPQGVSNVCASLDTNTENPLGGVCPNITHDEAGTALLALQFSFITILTCLHFVKSKHLHQDAFPQEGVAFDVQAEAGGVRAQVLQKQHQNKGKKPVNSIFFLKKK